jgi:hypothetical protein
VPPAYPPVSTYSGIAAPVYACAVLRWRAIHYSGRKLFRA